MDNNQKEQMKKTVRNLASHTEKAASMAKDKISQQMEQENVKKAAEAAAKGARKASEGITALMEEGKKGTDKKRTIILAVTAVIASCILGALGFAGILGLLLLISLGVLIYRAVKKKPKKNAAIATAVLFALSSIAGMFGNNGVPDNVLDYLGTKENVVYQIYDRADFEHRSDSGSITNVHKYEGNLPYLIIGSSGEVEAIQIVDRVSKESFHVNGLHVGDDLKQVEKWMEKSNVDWELDSSGTMGIYRYKGKDVLVTIMCEEGYARIIMAKVLKR